MRSQDTITHFMQTTLVWLIPTLEPLSAAEEEKFQNETEQKTKKNP